MTMPNLESKLKNHVWFYTMSDSQSVYQKGRAESNEISYLMNIAILAGESQEACELFNRYNPYGRPENFGKLFEKICVAYPDGQSYSTKFLTKEEYEAQN